MDYIDNICRSIGRVNKLMNALREIEDEIKERDDMARSKKEVKEVKEYKELDEELETLINVVSLSAYKYERQYTGKPLPNLIDQLREMTDNKVDKSKEEEKEERKKHNARIQREYKMNRWAKVFWVSVDKIIKEDIGIGCA